MDINIDSLKALIIENPGIGTKYLQDYFDIDYDMAAKWIGKLKCLKEDNGNEAWLFIQTNHGKSAYFCRVYARKNNTPEKILAPKQQHAGASAGGINEKRQEKDICRLSKSWAAPKRLRE